MTHRSDDPRPGDRARILIEDSIWTNLEGTVRNVYREKGGMAVSVVVHPLDATHYIREHVPVAPDGGFHVMCNRREIDIIQRSLYS